jgi:hypothetical protein
MNQTAPPLARLSAMDERARTTLRMASRTGMFAVAWLLARYQVAPVLGVRVVNPVEYAHAFFVPVAPTLPIGAEKAVAPAMVADAMLPSVQSIIELTLGMSIWTFGAIAALWGVATIGSALWYVVGRLIEPIAATDAGGEA